jgi:IS1 family transposase
MLKRYSNISVMNRLDSNTRRTIINCLIEGCSIRSTVRMTGAAKKTVMRVLVEIGAVCANFQYHAFRNLNSKRIQVDELWAFCYCKEKNVTPEIAAKHLGAGNVWLWVAIDADTKIVPCWYLGDRGPQSAHAFMNDLARRLSNRVQLTSDGHKAYLNAVEHAFGSEVDYSMMVKVFGSDRDHQVRYSPGVCIGTEVIRINGNPDPQHVSTSFAERQNWTVRTNMRRYTRLSNGFSRKIQNHEAAVALNYFAYNFIKIHRTLRTSPAMAAGVSNRLWEVSDLVALWESYERGEERAA